MRRMRLIGVTCVTALVLIAAGATRADAAGEYKTLEQAKLRIIVDTEWLPAAAPGYLPVRWDITNLGDDRIIEIVGNGSRGSRVRGYRSSRTSVTQRLRLRAGDRVRFTMNVPAGGDTNNMQFVIREDDRTIQTGFISSTRLGEMSALIVSAPNGAYAALAPGWLRAATYGRRFGGPPGGVVIVGGRVTTAAPSPRSTSGPKVDLILEPARLPTSWLAYTSAQAVVIGAREWDGLDAAQRQALLTWTACGGNLILVDAPLDTLFPDLQHRPVVDGRIANYFFGRVHLLPSAEIESVGFTDTLLAVHSAPTRSWWQLPVEPISSTLATRGFRLPVPGVNAIPARTYVSILALRYRSTPRAGRPRAAFASHATSQCFPRRWIPLR